MKRSGFKPGLKALQRNTALRPTAKLARTRTLKASRPKMTPIRRAARGEACTLAFAGICNRDPETSVWCHSNRYEHGKGLGVKANDLHGCIGCSACHAFYDGGYANAGWERTQVEACFDIASAASWVILRAKGIPEPARGELTA
jgi:hypothetical protein